VCSRPAQALSEATQPFGLPTPKRTGAPLTRLARQSGCSDGQASQLPSRYTASKSKDYCDRVPLKSRKPAISEQAFMGGESSVKDAAISVGLRGAGLLTIRPMRFAMGATVFVIGVLTGVGIAAWMMPPV
jgi:hypothetical protein